MIIHTLTEFISLWFHPFHGICMIWYDDIRMMEFIAFTYVISVINSIYPDICIIGFHKWSSALSMLGFVHYEQSHQFLYVYLDFINDLPPYQFSSSYVYDWSNQFYKLTYVCLIWWTFMCPINAQVPEMNIHVHMFNLKSIL